MHLQTWWAIVCLLVLSCFCLGLYSMAVSNQNQCWSSKPKHSYESMRGMQSYTGELKSCLAGIGGEQSPALESRLHLLTFEGSLLRDCRLKSDMGEARFFSDEPQSFFAEMAVRALRSSVHFKSLPCPALPSSAPASALPSPTLPCPPLPCPALPCPALPCATLPCPALPCPALPCPASPSSLRG